MAQEENRKHRDDLRIGALLVNRIARADVKPKRQPNQYSCVSTSLSMALEALGIPADECRTDRVNAVLGAMPLHGASWEQAAAAASHYGCRTTLVIPSTLKQVREWTDAGIPVLIGWNTGNEWSHASLIFDVDDTHVHIADPNIPNPDSLVRVLTHDEFYEKWWEKASTGYKIRRPALAVEREITVDGRQVMASAKTASDGHARLSSRTAAYRHRPRGEWDEESPAEYRRQKRDEENWYRRMAHVAKMRGDGKASLFFAATALRISREPVSNWGMTPSDQKALHDTYYEEHGKWAEEPFYSRLVARHELGGPEDAAELDQFNRGRKAKELLEEQFKPLNAKATVGRGWWRATGGLGGIEAPPPHDKGYPVTVEQIIIGTTWKWTEEIRRHETGYTASGEYITYRHRTPLHRDVVVSKDGMPIHRFPDGERSGRDVFVEVLKYVEARRTSHLPTTPAPKPVVDSAVLEKLTILDRLISEGDPRAAGIAKKLKDVYLSGKRPTDDELKQLRHMLYKNRMRAEADNFRMAGVKMLPPEKQRYTDDGGAVSSRIGKPKVVVKGPAPKVRDEMARGLIDRANAGGGKHKNKQDFDRGHARSPKHKKDWQEKNAAAHVLPWMDALDLGERHGELILFISTPESALYLAPGPARAEGNFDFILERKGGVLHLPTLQEIESYRASRAQTVEGIRKRQIAWWEPSGSHYQFGIKIPNPDISDEIQILGRPNSAVGYSLDLGTLDATRPLTRQILGKFDTKSKIRKHLTKFDGMPAKYRTVPSKRFLTGSRIDWKAAAEKLLRASKGTEQDDLHYRVYLREIIGGRESGHLPKLYPGAVRARQELIDLAGTGKYGAYSGNPDGKPIYPVTVDHGENQALSGGHDIMKRLQDSYRIEQGNAPRDPNPRLASTGLDCRFRLAKTAMGGRQANYDYQVPTDWPYPKPFTLHYSMVDTWSEDLTRRTEKRINDLLGDLWKTVDSHDFFSEVSDALFDGVEEGLRGELDMMPSHMDIVNRLRQDEPEVRGALVDYVTAHVDRVSQHVRSVDERDFYERADEFIEESKRRASMTTKVTPNPNPNQSIPGRPRRSASRNRFTDMDGNTFDVGSRVEWWPDARAKSAVGTVVGIDGKNLLIGGGPLGGEPISVSPAEVRRHVRVVRASARSNAYSATRMGAVDRVTRRFLSRAENSPEGTR